MNQMSETLRLAQDRMRREAEAHDGYVAGLEAEITELRQDLALVAAKATQTAEFLNWLMEQDNSSTLTNGRPGMGYGRSGGVEGRDDTELALAWAGRP